MPEPPEELERHISGIVHRLIQRHFPELEPITIRFVAATQNTDSVFLKQMWSQRRYSVPVRIASM